MSFNLLKQTNKKKARYVLAFCVYKQVCFRPQHSDTLKWISCDRRKVCLQYVLYLSILNFVVSLNNDSSQYIQMKSTVSPAHYNAKCSR